MCSFLMQHMAVGQSTNNLDTTVSVGEVHTPTSSQPHKYYVMVNISTNKPHNSNPELSYNIAVLL